MHLAQGRQGLLYAGGNFTSADGQPANFIAMWTGEQWRPLDSGMNWIVEDLLWDSDKLWVCGGFDRAGPTRSSQIAVWREAPVLRWLRSAPGDLTVSWNAAFSNYVLEASQDLAQGQWTPVNEQIGISGGERRLTNSTLHPQTFFRLRKD